GTWTAVPPTASCTYPGSGWTCHFDGGSSSDSDGTIISYQWSFGDGFGASSSGATTDHTYGQAGSYGVTLRVVDNGKATATSGPKTITLGNVAPTASFSVSCTGLSCNFDASASTDPDGTIAGYAWDFGDGSSGGGQTPHHPKPAPRTPTATTTPN